MFNRIFGKDDLTPAVVDARRPAARAPSGRRIYAVGDIHGRADLLDDLHERMQADAQDVGAARPVVVYLGDYVDRGANSRGVLDRLIEAPLPGFERYCLLGNHEAVMLEFLENVEAGPAWLQHGGDMTLASYGIDPRVPGVRDGHEKLVSLQSALADALPETHVDFLRALSATHVEGGYLFVHAGIRPGVAMEEQDREDLIWIREGFLSSRRDHGYVVVHGHTPMSDVDVRFNRIGIDTGACFTGRLTALVLEEDRQMVLQTR